MNRLLEFKKALDEHKEDPKALSLVLTSINTGFYSIGATHHSLITLDEEDIIYFKNKYLSKLHLELEQKIEEIKKAYNG